MFYLATRLICTVGGFVYPVYASYKAIKSSEADKLERWLMFWCVMGTVSIGEMTVEWLVNWLPLYYQAKTLVILWLTLPQIQGSSFVYLKYLEPFLQQHESDIDTAVTQLKAKAKAAGLGYLRQLWRYAKDFIVGEIANDSQNTQLAALAQEQSQPADKPISKALEPATSSQAWNFATDMLRQYAGPAFAAGHAVMHPMQSQAAPRVRTSSLPQNKNAFSSARDSNLRPDVRQRHTDPALASSRSSSPLEASSIYPLARRSPSQTISMEKAENMAYSMLGSHFEEIERSEVIANQSPAKRSSWFGSWAASRTVESPRAKTE